MTWLDLVKKDLKQGGLVLSYKNNTVLFEELEVLCTDRNTWRREVKHMMLIDSTYM